MIDDNIAAESINWWSPAAVCVLLSFVASSPSSFSPSFGQFGRMQTMRCSFFHLFELKLCSLTKATSISSPYLLCDQKTLIHSFANARQFASEVNFQTRLKLWAGICSLVYLFAFLALLLREPRMIERRAASYRELNWNWTNKSTREWEDKRLLSRLLALVREVCQLSEDTLVVVVVI